MRVQQGWARVFAHTCADAGAAGGGRQEISAQEAA
jgi:hypothetical protein